MNGLPPPAKLVLHVGQAVAWPAAPMGIAQISELRRKKVRICYPCKNGRIRQPVVSVAEVHRQQLLFAMHNPFDRGVVARSKEYVV